MKYNIGIYVPGDIFIDEEGRKNVVEDNHCGLAWPAGSDGRLFYGLIQVKDKFRDARSGLLVTPEEMQVRRGNRLYDYENKAAEYVKWRQKNLQRIVEGSYRIHPNMKYSFRWIRWKLYFVLCKKFHNIRPRHLALG